MNNQLPARQNDPNNFDKNNFMKPSVIDPIIKREQFAVSLRKKKTQVRLFSQRREKRKYSGCRVN